jgi:hypothetical protein
MERISVCLPAAACTVEHMATESAGLPADSDALVVPVDEIGDGGGMTLDELLAQIEAEEPVILPKPAAAYLEDARNANET